MHKKDPFPPTLPSFQILAKIAVFPLLKIVIFERWDPRLRGQRRTPPCTAPSSPVLFLLIEGAVVGHGHMLGHGHVVGHGHMLGHGHVVGHRHMVVMVIW